MTQFHEKIDSAVKDFADTLVAAVLKINPDIAMAYECEDTTSEDGKYHASICDIQTETGCVTIFPDFAKESAKAAILNRGLILAMELEGFDEDTINDSPVYGTLLSKTKQNVKTLALILTKDLGLQHQKNFDDDEGYEQ
jgi:hypothetical protein